MLRKLTMLREYKKYEFACLSRKNFIISQLLNFFGNVLLTIVTLTASFFLIKFVYPLISAHIAG